MLKLWLVLFDVFINNLENRRERAFSKFMDDTKLGRAVNELKHRSSFQRASQSGEIGWQKTHETIAAWKKMVEESSHAFPMAERRNFKFPFHYWDVTVDYRILQWLKKKKKVMCDLTWSQEGILHFTVVVSIVVWGSSSSRVFNYKLKNTQLRNFIRILVWMISLTGREIDRDSKSTEFLYAVFSFLQHKIIIYVPAAPCFLHTFQFTVNEKVILQMTLSQYSLGAD